DETEHTEFFGDQGPGKDEHRLDIEEDEEQAEDVVADVGLGPTRADRVDPGLVRLHLLRVGVVGAENGGDTQHHEYQHNAQSGEGSDSQVVLEVSGYFHLCWCRGPAGASIGRGRPSTNSPLS